MSAPSERPGGQTSAAHFSPKAAAQWARVSRRTIMRAIDDNELPAIRDNRGNWRIARPDLERWAEERPAPSVRPVSSQDAVPTAAHLEVAGLQALIARLEAELAEARAATKAQAEATAIAEAATIEARQRIAELEGQAKEAAAWRDALLDRLPSPPPTPRRRWWLWRS